MLSEVKSIDPVRASEVVAASNGNGTIPNGGHRNADMATGQNIPSDSERTIEELNALMERLQTNLVFSVDEATRRVVIKVVDANSGEVIRQIPPEETLRIASHISKLLGIFINETV